MSTPNTPYDLVVIGGAIFDAVLRVWPADRIRVVNDKGQNLRLHPETAELASTDPTLAYAQGDSHYGKTPAITAAAYTYNQQDSKLTTNYAIDISSGNLLTQGTLEGSNPAVSPNTGQLFTVGSLGLAALQQVSFDISDLSNIGLVAASTAAEPASMLYQIDLSSGKTKKLGTLADGSALPAWLSFDAATRTFSGTAPASAPASPLSLKLTATDAGGLSASTGFTLDITSSANGVPVAGQPLPNLWAAGGAARGVSGHDVSGYLSGNGLLSAVAGGCRAGRLNS